LTITAMIDGHLPLLRAYLAIVDMMQKKSG
jgi:hypothetical protein